MAPRVLLSRGRRRAETTLATRTRRSGGQRVLRRPADAKGCSGGGVLRRPAAATPAFGSRSLFQGRRRASVPVESLLAEFSAAHVASPSGDGLPGPLLRKSRRRLLRIATDERAEEASAAASLLIYSEALAERGVAEDFRVMAAGLEARRRLIKRFGRSRWDDKRVSACELLRAVEGADARRLSVLHRLVSLAAGLKHGGRSSELSVIASATVAALMKHGSENCCGLCFAKWCEADRAVVVPSCGHALHADCFWALVTGPCVPSYRGRCRTCRRPHRWGRMARANLRCTLAAASAAALACAMGARARELGVESGGENGIAGESGAAGSVASTAAGVGGGGNENSACFPPPYVVAELCVCVAAEIGEGVGTFGLHRSTTARAAAEASAVAVWDELRAECGQRNMKPLVSRRMDRQVRDALTRAVAIAGAIAAFDEAEVELANDNTS
eukprot:TRINITY_DN38520_c0_g1_i1.p1 TRINITY_DN38520_c0_g1~~TRINITY_DN38520_c0_g1_i1.p1  ORF type:complete len:445 (-),score=85.90 TRINITY_DN38520_c0_g1_i1:105-1439(-)